MGEESGASCINLSSLLFWKEKKKKMVGALLNYCRRAVPGRAGRGSKCIKWRRGQGIAGWRLLVVWSRLQFKSWFNLPLFLSRRRMYLKFDFTSCTARSQSLEAGPGRSTAEHRHFVSLPPSAVNDAEYPATTHHLKHGILQCPSPFALQFNWTSS